MTPSHLSRRAPVVWMPVVLAVYVPTCVTPAVRATVAPPQLRMEELWVEPQDLSGRDLFHGPWGSERAPAPDATYTFVRLKSGGMNPGMTVTDPRGREWRVKQPHTGSDWGDEGPVEVVVSRVLSAVGYHQPPVYYLPVAAVERVQGGERVVRREPGGRFRLEDPSLRQRGDWSWQKNPFVGTRPYQGLLVILLMFNSTDLKNSNNTLYEYRSVERAQGRWYVVRDLGAALGETGRVGSRRGDPDRFERGGFITGIEDGFVEFEYDGFHQELVDHRVTAADVRWASDLLARLSDGQWRDAFRAGGYDPATSERFIRRLREKVAQGQALASP